MNTGWYKENGNWYYFNSDGGMHTGWLKLSGKYYYMKSNGAMHTDWIDYGGSWYYTNSSGVMVTGLQYIDGKRYFFSHKSGAMQFFDGFDITFYSQTDPRLSGERYGAYTIGSSGCGITSIAMALTAVLNEQVLPTDVADYMYYHTSEYNDSYSGNSG